MSAAKKITAAMYPEYLRLRKNGARAIDTVRYLCDPAKRAPIDWEYDKAEAKRGKYTVRLELHPDNDCADLSFLGEYSNRYKSGSIDRKARGDCERGELQYWIPEANADDIAKCLHRRGLDRHSAHEAGRAAVLYDYKRHEKYCRGDWWMMGIVATAYIGDVECGSASLWGIASDAGDCINEIAHELIDEALADAKANTKRLIKKKAEEIATLASAVL